MINGESLSRDGLFAVTLEQILPRNLHSSCAICGIFVQNNTPKMYIICLILPGISLHESFSLMCRWKQREKFGPENTQSRTCADLVNIGALISARWYNACFREKPTSATILFSAYSTRDDVFRNETIKGLLVHRRQPYERL